MSMHQYIGARYVPRFLGTYDATTIYEAMDVVDNGIGTSYIAKIPTPAGTPLTDSAHWAIYGSSSGAIIALQNQVNAIQNYVDNFDQNVLPPLDEIADSIRTPEAYGAVGDGVTDDTAAINACLADGGYIVFRNGATYMIDAETNLFPQNGSIIDLNGATIKAITNGNDYYNIFMIDKKKGVVIRNGFIVGDRDTHTSATGEWGYGVYVRASEDILLDNLNITKCWGDGIAIGTAWDDPNPVTHNVAVTNCTISYCRRQGISIMWCYDVFVDNNLIENISGTSPESGIDVEPNASQSSKNIYITNNIIKNTVKGLIVSGAAAGASVDNVILSGNIIINSNASSSQLMITTAKNVSFVNNIFDVDAGSAGLIGIYRTTNLMFKDNNISEASITGNAITISNCNGMFAGNLLKNITASTHLIYILDSSKLHFINNVIDDCASGSANNIFNLYGESGYEVDKCTFKNNTIRNCTALNCINLASYTTNCMFENNHIDGTFSGYTFTSANGSSSDNVIAFNNIKSGASGSISGYGGTWPGSKMANVIDNVFTA